MKKESAKRGYVTKEEVEGHINKMVEKIPPYNRTWSHKDYVDSKKRQYIAKIKQRKGLLARGTAQAVDEIYRGYVKEDADSMYKYAEELSAGHSTGNMTRDCVNANSEAGLYSAASHKYEELGEYDKAIVSANKAVNAKFNARWLSPGDNPVGEQDLASEQADLEKRARMLKSKYGGQGGLEKATATASIVGLVAGIFFLSTNITGNAIADMATKTTSFLGAGLLIVGLVAGFFWLKGRKR